MKSKQDCALELVEPKLMQVSSPTDGVILGMGANFNVADPCIGTTFDKTADYVLIKGCHVDRNGILVPAHFSGTICEKCGVNRRAPRTPYTGKDRRDK